MRTTKHFHNALHLFVLMLTLLSSGPLLAQGLDPATIANPPADSWPSYHGDYSGRRHSPLTQITPQNVRSLTLAWAFQTGQPAALKSSPLLVNGILYFTVPDNVWAVDARSGHQIWHYTYPPEQGPAYWTSRRCHVQGLVVFHHSGCPPYFPGRQKRQSPLERPDRGC